MTNRVYSKLLNPTLLVVGLGYFADVFDLFLYNAVRVPSLRELGLSDESLTKTGLQILNLQVAGMFLGGFFWGVCGDKIGRKKALIGSVFLYSLGSLGCAFVHSVALYATMRFLTGIGLAGEMGLGAILICETMSARKKDWGILIYTLFAYTAILCANFVASQLPWRTCYAVGGVAGLLLLLGRMMVLESGLFKQIADTVVMRGSLLFFLKNPTLLKRWLCCVFFAIPYYMVTNLLITLAPEFGKAVNVAEPVTTPAALMIYAVCAMVGTIASVVISRKLKKRILTIALFMAANLILAFYYLTQNHPSAHEFYGVCALLGLFNFFTLLLFAAVEQFGTNMRATLGVSSLSAGRTTLVITNLIFIALRENGISLIASAEYVAAFTFGIGFLCLFGLKETFHRPIDFLEE